MKNRTTLLLVLLSMALVLSLVAPASVLGASGAVRLPDDHAIGYSVAGSSAAALPMALNTPEGNVNPMVAAGGGHIVGLKTDGTVVAVGENINKRCNVGGWTDITQVAAGWGYTVGLKTDGTVVAVGYDYVYGHNDVGDWTDTTQVAAGSYHTVGLRSDGTVVAVGENGNGRCDVGGWTDMTQVAAYFHHTVGFRDDGTVVATGNNDYGQLDANDWDLN